MRHKRYVGEISTRYLMGVKDLRRMEHICAKSRVALVEYINP